MATSRAAFYSTMRLPVVREAPADDWRYAALGLSVDADEELIERTYWYQFRRYSALAQTDPEALKRLETIKAAYQSLCPNAEPWTTRETGSHRILRDERRVQLADLLLMLVLISGMAITAALVMSDGFRAVAASLVQQVWLFAHHLLHAS